MENSRESDGIKAILLKAANLILKMPQKSIDIIKEKKMYHTKLIERSSKCTKDPNPLATTMILLNQKYPLALLKNEAIKYNIPKSLLAPAHTRGENEDSHRGGRVLARLNAIDWWIDKSAEPNEKLVRLSEVLFASSDQQVKEYYEANWNAARIKWGQQMLQRSLVRTKNPVVEIPQSLRNSAIKEVFFPNLTIPNPDLPTSIVSELKEKMGVMLEDNIPLTRRRHCRTLSYSIARRSVSSRVALEV